MVVTPPSTVDDPMSAFAISPNVDMFLYSQNSLQWRGHDVSQLIERAGSLLLGQHHYTGPFWIYQQALLSERLQLLEKGLPECKFYFSVKSQSNLTLLSLIAGHDRFGADVVSGGELYRALKSGFEPQKIVFAGVGKSEAEIALGLDLKIRSFHVESVAELKDIERIAASKAIVGPVSLRLNPDVEVDTHRHIMTGKEENKFGLSESDFIEALSILKGSKNLKLLGLQAHIGSQIFDVAPYAKTAAYLKQKFAIVSEALGTKPEYVSLGGGFGVDYHQLEGDAVNFDFAVLEKTVHSTFGDETEIHFEPGRFISAPLGILASQVRHLKQRTGKTIAIIDAAMNDLIRPMLYEAFHPILPITRRDKIQKYDIVGPVCESTDTFAHAREITELAENDWLAIGYAGAYGSVMSSTFNSRPLIPEVLIAENGDIRIIRKPQTIDQLLENEIF